MTTTSATRPVGRLAPSPTGAQHIGNARTYLLAWLSIRVRGGRVILRIEDIDSPRTKAGADQLAIADLHWLGLDWDEGPDIGGPHAPYYQTQRLELYADALHKLQAAERVYPCTCSRSDVLSAASASACGPGGAQVHGPLCIAMVASAAELTSGFCWRFRLRPTWASFTTHWPAQQACRG